LNKPKGVALLVTLWPWVCDSHCGEVWTLIRVYLRIYFPNLQVRILELNFLFF